MSEVEVASFLAQERTVTCATVGPRGWPHLMPLWYVLRSVPPNEDSLADVPGSPPAAAGPRVWAWTYAASQKVRNLERESRATLQVEQGDLYQELRGVMFECEVTIHRDLDSVKALGEEIFKRYAVPPVDELPPEVAGMVAKQARKRVALEFVERRRASWDHRKLGGVY